MLVLGSSFKTDEASLPHPLLTSCCAALYRSVAWELGALALKNYSLAFYLCVTEKEPTDSCLIHLLLLAVS